MKCELDELSKPLTAIEMAKLTTACKDVLTPAGLMLLRRCLFELELSRKQLLVEGKE